MVIHGRIENGVIVLSEMISLPEGTEVTIMVRDDMKPTDSSRALASPAAVRLPIFDSELPADIVLSNERIAEILDHDDASP